MMRPVLKAVGVLSMAFCLNQAALASGWIRDVNIASLVENNLGGEVMQFTLKEKLRLAVHCPDQSGFAIRDPATLKGSLALLTSALIAQRKVDFFLTGSCDSTGMPIVIGVAIH